MPKLQIKTDGEIHARDAYDPNNTQQGICQRELAGEVRAMDEENRTVEIAFSSEEPYERFSFTEILDHDTASVRLGRLNNAGAVLVNHDRDDHVGVVESARIDDDRVGRAVVRFSRGKRGDEIFQDVVDGIRQLVSVGYMVHKFEEEDKPGGAVVVRATDWEPLELSIVSIPADPSVGVGRNYNPLQINPEIEEKAMSDKDKNQAAADNTPAKNEPQVREMTQAEREAEMVKIRTAENERIEQIRAMGAEHDMDELAREHIEAGTSYKDFNRTLLDEIGKRNAAARGKSDSDGNLDLSRNDRERFSLTRLMYAVSNPEDRSAQRAAAFEMEVGIEAAKQFGPEYNIRGVFVPEQQLSDVSRRDLSAGVDTALVGTEQLGGSFVDVLRNAMVVGQAGARIMSGLSQNVDIPRKTAGAAAAFIATEDGDAAESEPTFDQIQLTPKDMGAVTEVTRRLMLQSSPDVEALVRDDLAQAIGLATDLAALSGSGAGGNPTGVANQTGVNTFAFVAAAPTYAETVRMIKECALDNAIMGNLAYIIDPEGWEDAMTTEKASGTAKFIMSESGTINGYQVFVTNQVATEDWFFGNWEDVIIGEWGGLELIVDPYSQAQKGRKRFVVFKTMDIGVRHPGSFTYAAGP